MPRLLSASGGGTSNAAATMAAAGATTTTPIQEPSATVPPPLLEDIAATNSSDLETSLQVKQAQLNLSTNAAAAMQHIHIISSDDDDDDKEQADQKMTVTSRMQSPPIEEALSALSAKPSDFAGFPSPGSKLNDAVQKSPHNAAMRHTKHSQPKQLGGSGGGALGTGMELRKRSACTAQHSSDTAGSQVMQEQEQLTPVKRKRQPQQLTPLPETSHTEQSHFRLLSSAAEQIVEINSNSTTHSQRQQRLQRRSAHTLQTLPTAATATGLKCSISSSETSTEFPVSSPSNPQLAGAGGGGAGGGGAKFAQRTPLLKNTLPADSFERQLALITTRNPQMSLDDKMRAWHCSAELSDVEDVNTFDELFERSEAQKRKSLRATKNKQHNVSSNEPKVVNYDFAQFRQVMIENLKAQQKQLNERATTSANAAGGGTQPLQRRQKHNSNNNAAATLMTNATTIATTTEKKTPTTTTRKQKKPQSSTTPAPASSSSQASLASSDNVAACYAAAATVAAVAATVTAKNCNAADTQNAAGDGGAETLKPTQQLHFYEKLLCPSSSDNSLASKRAAKAASTRSAGGGMASKADKSLTAPPLNLHWTSTDEESVFRLHRLNPEIDKNRSKSCCDFTQQQPQLLEQNLKPKLSTTSLSPQPKRLIELHLDFMPAKKQLNLREKKGVIFKTPSLPLKYLPPAAPHIQLLHHHHPYQMQQHKHHHHHHRHQHRERQHQSLSPPNSPFIRTEKATHSLSPNSSSSSSLSPLPTADAATAATAATTQQTAAASATPQLGFHQQHEFCSYLGLTGMSTANAVANAVAELAKCKLARRSLRVRRLQHAQDKQQQQHLPHQAMDNNQSLAALKQKQLRELQKRDYKSAAQYDNLEELQSKLDRMESMATSLLNPRITRQSQVLHNIQTLAQAVNSTSPTVPPPTLPKTSAATTAPAAATTSAAASKEHEIKIICHIDALDKEKLRAISKDCVQAVAAPIRQTLMRQLQEQRAAAALKNKNNSKQMAQHETMNLNEVDEEEQKQQQPDVVVEDEESEYEKMFKQQLKQEDDEEDEENLAETFIKLEHTVKLENLIKVEEQTKNKDEPQLQQLKISRIPMRVERLRGGGSDLLENQSPPSSLKQQQQQHEQQQQKNLHMKFQEYLEASRRTKPTIFIVQAIDSGKRQQPAETSMQLKKETTPARSIKAEKAVVVDTATNAKKPVIKTSPIGRPKSSKSKLRKLLTRSMLNLTQQRQLRSRKIFILKTKKSSSNNNNYKNVANAQCSTSAATKSKFYVREQQQQQKQRRIQQQQQQRQKKQQNRTFMQSAKVEPKVEKKLTPKVETKVDSRADTKLDSKLEPKLELKLAPKTTAFAQLESIAEAVVVSSTTNCFDEAKEITNNCLSSKPTFVVVNTGGGIGLGGAAIGTNDVELSVADSLRTKDSATQSLPHGICQLNSASNPLLNPLQPQNGKALHIYYELDVLIVVQEFLVSFWKYSKLINMLRVPSSASASVVLSTTLQHKNAVAAAAATAAASAQQVREAESTSTSIDSMGEWLHLGECKRLLHDIEIASPYTNRICVHNSIPIYVEMRCKELQKERRDCNLLSLYINIYYYNDEDMHAKMHSIQLDAVQSFPANVIYTTITDSRYFVMSWPQENMMGKVRSGLCKYSLTPHLDTLASIREFKSMRHEILCLECTEDDKLLGFGATQVTIWDHRSGDVLMNYDLDMNLGRNLGSVYYPSLEIGHCSMLLLFQYMSNVPTQQTADDETNIDDVSNVAVADAVVMPTPVTATGPEVHVIACSISHATPSHRVLYRHPLPSPQFNQLTQAINTGEHMLLTATNDEEIWISCADPKMLTLVPAQCTQRFYARGSSQLIELTEQTLTVDSFANHVLKLAAATAT